MIFDNLVFYNTHARFRYRHLRKRNTLVVRRKRRRRKNFVNLLLRVRRKNFLSFPDLRDLLHQSIDCVNDFFVLHLTSPCKLFFIV